MTIDSIFNSASSVMTLVSLVTFLGILWWTFGVKRGRDFDAAARVPFADDADAATSPGDLPAARTVSTMEKQDV